MSTARHVQLRAETVVAGEEFEEPNILRRAPRIREEEVRQTADALLLEGDRPTVERVRQRLGRGSPNTIALFLDRWWAQLGARLRDMPGQELPGVPSTVSAALVSLWSCAIDEARALLKDTLATQAAENSTQQIAVAEQAAALHRAREEFERERTALVRTVDMLEDQLRFANDRNQADAKSIQELRADLSRLTDQRDQGQQELLKLTARLEVQTREHETSLNLVRERAEASERHWIKQVDDSRQTITQERKRWENSEKVLQTDLTRVTAQLATAQNERESLRVDLGRAHHDAASMKSRIEGLEEAVKLERARADEVTKRLDARASNELTADGLEARLRDAISTALGTDNRLGSPRKRTRSTGKTQK